MHRRAWIVLLAAVALSGCGGEEPKLSARSAEQLRAQVAAVGEAARLGDRDAALKALDGLQARVRELQDGGALAGADATALRRGIGQARRRVRAEVAEPTPTPAATPVPTATVTPVPTAAPEEQPGNGKGKGKGKAKDRDEDEEGDD